MTHDEVRQRILESLVDLAPQLARAVLEDRTDAAHALAAQVSALSQLSARYDEDRRRKPDVEAMALLRAIERELNEEVAKRARPVSVWERIRRSTLDSG